MQSSLLLFTVATELRKTKELIKNVDMRPIKPESENKDKNVSRPKKEKN